MKINTIETFRAAVPLKKPFKTALRTVETAETLVIKVTCDNGIAGWGEAPPTVVITGDSLSSIESSIHHVLKPMLINKSLLNYEAIFQGIQSALIGNSSAKAAVDMALYDCLAQQCKLPLYQFLGGHKNGVETD